MAKTGTYFVILIMLLCIAGSSIAGNTCDGDCGVDKGKNSTADDNKKENSTTSGNSICDDLGGGEDCVEIEWHNPYLNESLEIYKCLNGEGECPTIWPKEPPRDPFW